jgi:hypothetical protein
MRISKTIPSGCRWIVVFDMNEFPFARLPKNAEYHCLLDHAFGYPQSNCALDLVYKGMVYFLDDDTLIHPDLYDTISGLDNDFIHFNQIRPKKEVGHPKYMIGKKVKPGWIDKGGFVVNREVIGDIRFRTDIYGADGYFAEECYNKATKPVFIDKVLAYHNKLDYD